MNTDRIVVIGAGAGGLAAAIDLAARGHEVLVCERAASAGGKLHVRRVAGREIDSGPTVLTMRAVFEDLFATAGTTLDALVRLEPAEVLARHTWDDCGHLDLHADPARTRDDIARFCGPREARAYDEFSAAAAATFRTLDLPFLHAPRPTPVSLSWRIGLHRPDRLLGIRPFRTLWQELGRWFRDPRLRQLFGRYATYCGSSPFDAPATLMLVAHVERAGVWTVGGGLQRLAEALATAARRAGARVECGAAVDEILVERDRVAGVRLADGRSIAAAAVVSAVDAAALPAGCLGPAARAAIAPWDRRDRSLSAATWSMVARARGFPLVRHSVFFSSDYAAEFEDLFEHRRPPIEPTVYVCAQDRPARDAEPLNDEERLFCLINAPPDGDRHSPDPGEIDAWLCRMTRRLEHCGLELTIDPAATVVTTPTDFATRFPATGGALYGRASHGWRASFLRPGSRTALPGLYLAGGSTHPGPGLPMATLSGRLAAESLCRDLDSIARSRRAATRGGISTRPATTGARPSR